MTIVVMGVSGSGKSTVMHALATRLGWPAAEGDNFHPRANIEKMRGGRPLSDRDRWRWLDAIAGWIGEQEAAGTNAIVTCSALKRAYRDRLREGHSSVWFAHLAVPTQVIAERLELRAYHFMPPSLLISQLVTLEPLGADEPGSAVPAIGTPGQIVDGLLARLSADRPGVAEIAAGAN